MAVAQQVLAQVFDDPAADDRVIGDDQDGDNGVDPAAEAQRPGSLAGLCKKRERAHGAFAGHAAQSGFRHDHRIAEGERQQDVNEQKNTAAVLGGQIREPPDVAQPDGGTGSGQHKAEFAGKGASRFV